MLDRVIRGGYCVGCSACAAVPQSPLRVRMNAVRAYEASPPSTSPGDAVVTASAVCPFSDDASNEDEIAAAVFDASLARHDAIGAYASCFAGHVVEDAYRCNGSSGGMESWAPLRAAVVGLRGPCHPCRRDAGRRAGRHALRISRLVQRR
jgi:hypothetical protein